MAENAVKFNVYKLTMKVIAQNIPPNWIHPFHMMELHLKETIKDIMLHKLLIIEDQYKEPKSHNQKHVQGKNPKNKRNNEQTNSDNNQDYDNRDNRNCQNKNCGTNNRRSNSEEFRHAENRNEEHTHNHDRNARHRQRDEEATDYDSNCIMMENNDGIPSAEILITIPKDKNHKQYKTYLGLVEPGTWSSSLPLTRQYPKRKVT
jgi:hypothetical protein